MRQLEGKTVEVLWHGTGRLPTRLKVVETCTDVGFVKFVDENADAVFGSSGFWIDIACIREVKTCMEPV